MPAAICGSVRWAAVAQAGAATWPATARKMAERFWRLLTKGAAYVRQGIDEYEKTYHFKLTRSRQCRLRQRIRSRPAVLASAVRMTKAFRSRQCRLRQRIRSRPAVLACASAAGARRLLPVGAK
jgi:hypothetical protein